MKDEDVLKQLDEEKHRFLCIEDEGKLLASKRNENQSEKEKNSSAKREHFPDILIYCKARQMNSGSRNWNYPI